MQLVNLDKLNSDSPAFASVCVDRKTAGKRRPITAMSSKPEFTTAVVCNMRFKRDVTQKGDI